MFLGALRAVLWLTECVCEDVRFGVRVCACFVYLIPLFIVIVIVSLWINIRATVCVVLRGLGTEALICWQIPNKFQVKFRANTHTVQLQLHHRQCMDAPHKSVHMYRTVGNVCMRDCRDFCGTHSWGGPEQIADCKLCVRIVVWKLQFAKYFWLVSAVAAESVCCCTVEHMRIMYCLRRQRRWRVNCLYTRVYLLFCCGPSVGGGTATAEMLHS